MSDQPTAKPPQGDPAQRAANSESSASVAIDFATFILSLASSGMVHLGKVPDPAAAGVAPNLEMARQTIEILSLLRDKTRGNLDAREAALLDRVLHDLRLAWVEEARKHTS
jgi:hypothetical protein